MGLYACGTARNRKGFPMNELKEMRTRKRGEIAWLQVGTTPCWH